jgi:hypothetical protein
MSSLPKTVVPVKPTQCWEALGRCNWMFGLVLGRGGRWNGLTSDEILSAHNYRNEGKRLCGILLGLILFRFEVPPLQPGVVKSYPIWRVWFPIVCCYRELVVSRILGHNSWSVVLRVLLTDSSSWAFHRAGGWSQSLDVRQNGYSYITVGV